MSDKVYQTIAEVASLLDVQPSALRYWETQFPQLHPIKSIGGRRQYRVEDVELLKTIHYYLYSQRYTIEGVKKVLKEGSSKMVSVPKDEGLEKFVKEMESVKNFLEDYV